MINRILALRQSVMVEILVIVGSVVLGAGAIMGSRRAVIQSAEISLERTSLRAMLWLENRMVGEDSVTGLRENANRLARLRRGEHLFFWVIDLSGRFAVYTGNPELVGKLIPREELIDLRRGDRPSFEAIHGDQAPLVGRYRAPDGESHVLALTPMAEHGFLVGVHSPLDRLLADFHRIAIPGSVLWGVFSLVFLPWVLFARRRAMRAVGERLSQILGQVPDVVWSTKGYPPEVAYVSPACKELTGYTGEELKSSSMLFWSRVDKADQARYREAIWALGSGRVVTEEFRFHRRDGEVIWIFVRMSPTLDSKGRLIRADGICSDVTRRKRAELGVQEAEAHYRSLVEQTDIVLVRILPTGEFVYMSPQVKRIVGYSAQEMMTDPGIFDQIVFAADREKLELLRETRRQLRPEAVEVEIRYRHRDGGTIWMYEKQIPVTDELGTIVYYDITALDISARKRLEEQLLESQKLELLGNLAAGVAHDFNNILTVISATAELMEGSLASGEGIGRNLKSLRWAADQAGDMVRGLLTFGQKRQMRRRDCDLNAVVEEGMRVIRRVMPKAIEIEMNLGAGVGSIHGDSGQLQYALLNLCLQAKEAMPDGGRLRVTTEMTTIESRQAAVRPEIRAGVFVVLRVSQTVAGSISPGSGKRVGDSARSGRHAHHPELGLATVYQAIREHAGWVDVHTGKDVETVVSVYLPVAGKVDREDPETSLSGTEQILVVDRDQMIAGFIKTVLEQRGYRVETANGTEGAMRFMSGNGGAFSAVIIDLENGDSGKLAWLQQLRETDSGLGAILIGGGEPDDDLRAGLEHPMTMFLEKPFQAADLAECLRSLLDQKSAGV
jgi:PAS domain S-box-containing protein